MEYTETVFPVNRDYTVLDIPRAICGGEYAGMDFATNLKRARKAAGLTQAELAERLNVSQPAVQRWETGKREPGYFELGQLAGLLGIALPDLIGNEPSHVPIVAGAVTPSPTWTPSEATLRRLLEAATPAFSPSPVDPDALADVARAFGVALRLIADRQAIEDDEDQLSVAAAVVADAARDHMPPQFPSSSRKQHHT